MGVGHDADDLGAEALHARNGAVDFGQSDGEVTGDGLAPVADEGAELGDGDSGVVELIRDGMVNSFFGEFVNVAAIDATGGDFVPANFVGGFDLGSARSRAASSANPVKYMDELGRMFRQVEIKKRGQLRRGAF